MRKDLAKCTTESPRAGAKGKCYKTKYGGRVHIHPDPDHDYPNEHGGYRSSARKRHWEYKSFTDVLNPLRGAIRSNLGRPWDDVYSEFAQLLDRRSVSGIHIWGHFLDEVAINTYMGVDGNVYCKSGYGGIRALGRYRRGEFYVHPYTKILSYYPPPERKGYEKPRKLMVPGMEPWEYRKIDGLWFRCIVVERYPIWHPRWNRAMETVYERKQSCNKKEIRWIKAQLNG